jgi:hypothetical protein
MKDSISIAIFTMVLFFGTNVFAQKTFNINNEQTLPQMRSGASPKPANTAIFVAEAQ